MISYYQSKHPGLFIYLSLIIITVLTLLFFNISPKIIGILSIIWGSFLTMRTLSLYEVSEHFQLFTNSKRASKFTNNSTSSLAQDLSKRKMAHNHMRRGHNALDSIKVKSFLWVIIGVVYCASYTVWNAYSNSIYDIASHICLVFIVGTSFWCGQTYAYSNQASRIILRVVSTLFFITLITNPSSFNAASSYDLTELILAALIIYSGACMLYALKNNAAKKINAVIGITILTIISLYSSYPLWMCGLSLFSIFWIRSFKNTQKSYVLYQCE